MENKTKSLCLLVALSKKDYNCEHKMRMFRFDRLSFLTRLEDQKTFKAGLLRIRHICFYNDLLLSHILPSQD